MMRYLPLFCFFFVFQCSAISANAQSSDSIKTAIAPEYNQVGGFHKFWLGSNYRELWATPVKIRVLNLSKEHGGMQIVKPGGGMQTRSLRLVDNSGREWVLRTVQKYPERGLPLDLQPTIAKDILQDQVSTGHPFGALVVPPLAAALSLPHASPELVYVGDDPRLGEYRKDFANAVYLFESRQPFESADTDNTLKVQQKLLEDNDTEVRQKLVLRARLLDFLVGDWDRHEDNWRWDKQKKQGESVYTPIPRDRDKVFYKTSGVLPWILSHEWLKSNIQPYSGTIRDIKTWNYNARYFDRFFLTQVNQEDWVKEVRLVQSRLTDQLLEEAMSKMPDTIFKLSGRHLLPLLKQRRDNLMPLALEYYSFLSRTIDIPMSEKREFVDVNYLENGKVNIRIDNKKKDGTRGRKLYERTFRQDSTSEIRIYGVAGEDVYQTSGQAVSKIKVRLIGGMDKDEYLIPQTHPGANKLFIYDGEDAAGSMSRRRGVRLKTSSDTAIHAFDPRSFVYNRSGPIFLLNYGFDQGLLLSAGFMNEVQGFRKSPYAKRQEFGASYSTGRQSWAFRYEADFKSLIGKNDLNLEISSLGPHHVGNFFGLGNASIYQRDDDRDISFYRNRFDYLTADLKLKRQLGSSWDAELGLSSEYYASKASNNTAKFFNAFNASFPEEGIYQERLFTGISAGLIFDTRADALIPHRGTYWSTQLTAKTQLNGSSRSYGRISSEVGFYLALKDSSIVLANRIGGGSSIGDPLFFQQMSLGGERNLRGFRTNRFVGHSMLYHNLELRMRVLRFSSYLLPGSIGLIAFNDIGRVWVPRERSSEWHDGYGGGAYISPANRMLIQALVGFSKEGTLPYITLGFSF
ncbi:MAG: BamA/TamA family outer membrane protein [Arcticibacter sp.]